MSEQEQPFNVPPEMFETFKVRAACTELGIVPSLAKLMVHVHTLTRHGIDFSDPQLGVPGGRPEVERQLNNVLEGLDRFPGGRRQAEDIRRVITDAEYGAMALSLYRDEVEPRAREMTLERILAALATPEPDE